MKGVVISKLSSFRDKRGEFVQLWKQGEFEQIGFWSEDDISVSKKNVLRGLHGDSLNWKFVTCLEGEVFFVAINPITKAHKEVILTGENHFAVLIPPNRAIGYLILSKKAIVYYKQSHGLTSQFTLPWDGFSIPWPIKKPILSKRDKGVRKE